MAFLDFLFGRGEQQQQLPTLNPQQQQLLQQMLSGQGGLGQSPLFGQASSLLQGILSGQDQGAAALEAPAMRQFQEQIIPGIAERFSGLGAGAQSSSAFQQALGGAGAGLAERLAAMQSERQTGALGQALPFAQAPFQQQMGLLGVSPFQNIYSPRQPGFLESGITSLLGNQGFGKALGSRLF